jgi:hypothetical protein
MDKPLLYLHLYLLYAVSSIELDTEEYLIMSGLLRIMRTKDIIKAGSYIKSLQNTSFRFMQMHAKTERDHPWTRDQLAERVKILKARRLDKYILRNKFATFRQSSSVGISGPIGLQQV